MRTCSSGPVVKPSTTPKSRRNKKYSQQVDPTIIEKPVVTMADTRTMAELLQAPTEGYGDAIVIPAILAENFELKHGLLNLVTSKQFCGFEKMSTEMLLAKEKLIKAIRTCLKNNNQPPEEKSIAVLLAKKSILTVMQTLEEKQNDTESMQELLFQLSKDLQTLENIDETPPSDAITPDLPITNSLVMEDEHLDTIQKRIRTKKISSVEDLNLTPSESKDLSDIESECDVPICDDFTTFSNPLFDSYNNSTSSDDESFSDEDIPKENFKNYSNPLFDEEIISIKIDPHHFNAESDLIESLLNKDTVITSPKIDFLLEEFTGVLSQKLNPFHNNKLYQ
ncbi:hypothetical protein Tco_0857710 [Tanacetum coccineum]|uniref:Reverse transcriptase domain-containing protein n=1 Tax=Tanacetum coccineum TaxID=301880 RepID=A0ABQ5BAZ3_9ASTR